MIEWEQARAIMSGRLDAQGPTMKAMREILTRYNGTYVIPMPDVKGPIPDIPPLTPALVHDAIDHTAMRAASQRPRVFVPPVEPSKQRGVRSKEFAAIRRRVNQADWHYSHLPLLLRRFYRHQAAYGTGVMGVIPDFADRRPRIVNRDPMFSFPDPRAVEDLTWPENHAFIYQKSAMWLREHYPQSRLEMGGPVGQAQAQYGQELWYVGEWNDTDQTMIGILGPADHGAPSARNQVAERGDGIMLSWWANPLGFCPFVSPWRITLERVLGQVTHLLGLVDMAAKLTMLDMMASEKAIFPDTFMIGVQGGIPEIVGGEWQDGRTGQVNMLADVQSVGQLRHTPDPAGKIATDRAIEAFRMSAGLSPQMSGNATNAVRTGRGIQELLEASIDPRIQELHEIVEPMLDRVNEACFEMYRTFWPSRSYTLFTGTSGERSMVEFTPSVHIESAVNAVRYPFPGMDAQSVTVVLGQKLQAGLISLAEARELDPWTEDPDASAAQVNEERLEELAWAALTARVQSGEAPMIFLAMMQRHLEDGDDIFGALEKADRELREMQAAQAPEPAEGQVAAPETLPGPEPQAIQQAAAPPQAPPDVAAALAALTSQGAPNAQVA